MVPESSDKEVINRAVRKAWVRLIPFLLIALILYNFDKASFTFAIPDMETSLRLTPFIAGLAAGIFFFGYLTFSIPGTYLTQKRGVKLLLPVWIVGFGVFATLTGYVQNAVELLVIRYLVGFFEGPFAPSITYFISTWFPREQRALAMSLYLLGIPISGIIGSPIQGWLVEFYGWRFMFIALGVPTIILGLLAFFYLTERPSDAKWLSDDEKRALLNRLLEERKSIEAVTGGYSIGRAVRDWRTITLAIYYFFAALNFAGIFVWMPTILYLASKLGLYYIGWILGGVWFVVLVVMVVWGRHSDRTGERFNHVGVGVIISLIGALMTYLFPTNVLILAIGLSLIIIGTMMGISPFWALITQLFTGAASATVIALIDWVGNVGSFTGPTIFGYFEGLTGNFILVYLTTFVFYIIALALLYTVKYMTERKR